MKMGTKQQNNDNQGKIRVYIYGTGRAAVEYAKRFDATRYELVGFLDSDKKKKGEHFRGKSIYHMEDKILPLYDEIHIASNCFDIYLLLSSLGIEDEKIVLTNTVLLQSYLEKTNGFIQGIKTSLDMSKAIVNDKMIAINSNQQDVFCSQSGDYFRYKVAQLLSEEVLKNKIDGNIAELGVFRGEFSSFLNKIFPDKKLYLFDTFEGFNMEEKIFELAKGFVNENAFENCNDFRDTNTELVLNKMEYPELCVVCKGFFPETAKNIEDKFSFVSLDCDLYAPILEGLKYFYPRLCDGGYIMLHDYNNMEFMGGYKAVEAYELMVGRLHKVPLGDRCGTVVISK